MNNLPCPFGHYREISDLGLDVLTSLLLGQYIKASVSLFRALGQWGRIGKKRGTSVERGLVGKEGATLSLPNPARRSSRASFRSVPTDREPGTG